MLVLLLLLLLLLLFSLSAAVKLCCARTQVISVTAMMTRCEVKQQSVMQHSSCCALYREAVHRPQDDEDLQG